MIKTTIKSFCDKSSRIFKALCKFKETRERSELSFRIVVCSVLLIEGLALLCFGVMSKNITDVFVITIALLIIDMVFINQYFNMMQSYIKIKNQLNKFDNVFSGINNISEFTRQYESIKEEVGQIDHFSNIWREFCETLIVEKRNNEIVRYKNTAQTELYINHETVITQQSEVDKLDSVPGILTGIGLAGTFTAITIALFGFSIENLNASIENLLGGLSVKFISSLAGIATSIIFISIKKHLFSNLNKSLIKLQNHLNAIFPRRTTESFLSEILEEIKDQSTGLKEFFMNMDFQNAIKRSMEMGLQDLKPEFANIRDAINFSIETMKESKDELFGKIDELNNNLSRSLSDSITNSLSSIMGNFASAIDELKSSMEAFKNLKQESSASLIQNLIDELKGCISNMQTSLTDAVVGGSENTIGNLQKALVDTGSYLANSQQMYQTFINNLQEQLNKHNSERDEAVSNVVNKTIENVNIQNDRIGDWVSQINNYIAEIHSNEINVKNNYSDLLNSINLALDKQQILVENNTHFISSLINASSQISNTTDKLYNSQNLLKENIDNSNNANSQFIQKINEFNHLNEDVNRKIEANIRIIEQQASAYDGINANSAKLIETLTQSINDFAERSKTLQMQVFEEFSKNYSEQLAGLTSIVHQQKEIISELADTIETVNIK